MEKVEPTVSSTKPIFKRLRPKNENLLTTSPILRKALHVHVVVATHQHCRS